MKVRRENRDGKVVLIVTTPGAEGAQATETVVPLEGVDGIYTREQVTESFVPKKDWSRRAQKFADKALEEAVQDDDFKAKALAAWGIKVGEDGTTGTLTADQVKALEASWTREHVTPLQTRATAAETEVSTLRTGLLRRDIMSYARTLGFKEEFTKPVRPGQEPLIVNMLEAYFGYDAEGGAGWLAKDGDGFALSAKPSGDRTYQDVEEFMTTFAAENPGFVDAKAQGRIGAGQPGGPKGPQDKAATVAALEAEGKFGEAAEIKASMLG